MTQTDTTTTPAAGTAAPAEPVDSGRRNNAGQRLDDQGNVISEVGGDGISLGTNREIAGGVISAELRPEPTIELLADPLRWHRRYMASKLASDAGHLIARAPENIGLWGHGDTYHGSGILINIDTLEKVRVYDGYKFVGDEVFANTRDLPHALVDGDVAQNLAGPAKAGG